MVRFRGPVGKLALVGIICQPSLCAIALKTSSPTVQGLCGVLATLVALFVVGAILWYSHTHPDQATLDRMEVVKKGPARAVRTDPSVLEFGEKTNGCRRIAVL
jgi:hypothetical protein